MNLKWNEVTWYSRLGALIIFLILVPIIAFIIGERYQEVKDVEKYRELESSLIEKPKNELSISYATSTLATPGLKFEISMAIASSSDRAVEEKINQSIEKNVSDSVRKYEIDFSKAPCKDKLGRTCVISINITSTTTQSSAFNSLSVEIDSFITSEQMANPNFERLSTVTYDAQTGDEKKYYEYLGVTDAGSPGLDKISQISRAKLKQAFGNLIDYTSEVFLKGTDSRLENYNHVLLDEEGIRILFSYYQLGPRPLGAPEVFITYKELGL